MSNQYKEDIPNELECKIKAICDKYKIPQSSLEYNWNGLNEAFINLLFQYYNLQITKAVQKDFERKQSPNTSSGDSEPSDDLRQCITNVLNWGGIHSASEETIKEYALQLLEMESVKDKKEEVKKVITEKVENISSWTKVLAAYAPDCFWIYDSRVAIALRFLYPETNWFIPQAHGVNVQKEVSEMRNKLNEINKKKKSMTKKLSYLEYYNLLNTTCSPHERGHYEKRLFMLGGLLLDHYKDNKNILDDLARSIKR